MSRQMRVFVSGAVRGQDLEEDIERLEEARVDIHLMNPDAFVFDPMGVWNVPDEERADVANEHLEMIRDSDAVFFCHGYLEDEEAKEEELYALWHRKILMYPDGRILTKADPSDYPGEWGIGA